MLPKVRNLWKACCGCFFAPCGAGQGPLQPLHLGQKLPGAGLYFVHKRLQFRALAAGTFGGKQAEITAAAVVDKGHAGDLAAADVLVSIQHRVI